MEDDAVPPTQPSGSMIPPPKIPGTALALLTPPPPPEPSRRVVRRYRGNPIARALNAALDVADEVADAIASGLRLRPR